MQLDQSRVRALSVSWLFGRQGMNFQGIPDQVMRLHLGPEKHGFLVSRLGDRLGFGCEFCLEASLFRCHFASSRIGKRFPGLVGSVEAWVSLLFAFDS